MYTGHGRFHQNGGTGGGEVACPAQVWILDVRGSNGYVQKEARFAIYVHGAPGVATVCYWKVGARAVPPKRRNRWRGGRSPGPGLDFGCRRVKWICSKRNQISNKSTRCTRRSRGFVLGVGCSSGPRNRWRGGRSPGPGLDFGCRGVKRMCSKRNQISNKSTRCTRCSRGFALGVGCSSVRRNRWRGGRGPAPGPGLDFGCPGVKRMCSKRNQISNKSTRCTRCSRGSHMLHQNGGGGHGPAPGLRTHRIAGRQSQRYGNARMGSPV